MGVGKTTIGSQLAHALRFEFIDSDREIEARTGAKIPLIFELEGEEGFRNRETQAIDDLTQRSRIVLATGGGAVLREQNREFLCTRGIVTYLTAPIDVLLARTARDKNRPLLQTEDPEAVFKKILQQRAPIYQEMAHITIDTSEANIRDTVKKIIHKARKKS